jgi:dTDP-4-dehydrorhamnose 3,5-epimerase|tara:strand:+ start:24 stop:485 length:462 start_codon:yes stop_codon:yes gene_type:complete
MKSNNIEMGSLNGVELIKIKNFEDPHGILSVLVSQGRIDAPNAKEIGEVYLVSVPRSNTTRASHKHKHLDEFFVIIEGSAKFFLLDDRKDSSTYGKKESFTLNSETGNALFIPRGIYHAFVTLTDNTKCLAISNRPFDQKNPDVYKIPISKIM